MVSACIAYPVILQLDQRVDDGVGGGNERVGAVGSPILRAVEVSTRPRARIGRWPHDAAVSRLRRPAVLAVRPGFCARSDPAPSKTSTTMAAATRRPPPAGHPRAPDADLIEQEKGAEHQHHRDRRRAASESRRGTRQSRSHSAAAVSELWRHDAERRENRHHQWQLGDEAAATTNGIAMPK